MRGRRRRRRMGRFKGERRKVSKKRNSDETG